MPEALKALQGLGGSHPTDIKAKNAILAILNEFGGYEEWARQVALDLEACDAGSASRIKLHQLLLNAIMRYDVGTEGDDEISTEDLEATVMEQMSRLQGEN